MERVFDGDVRATETFTSYVSRLRRRLERAGDSRSVLDHDAGAYTLALAPADVDWLRFRALHGQALAAERAGDDDTALARLDQARELWQGEPLTGLEGTWVQGMRETMRRRHRSVLADRGRVALRLHPPEDLIGQLAEDAGAYPLNGPLTQNLMVALHEAGRTEEALTTYQTLRDRLVDAQGTDPDQQLHATYLRMLDARDGNRDSDGEADGGRTGRSAGPHRHNLPRDLTDFSGRHTELDTLLRSVRAAAPHATAVHVVSGMPGVGKSALALRAGHLLREDFPDARLHLDLHGNREQPPKDTGDALRELLAMLGVPVDAVPCPLEERAALWRDRTAGLRALVILDDARDHEQVRWLLPGGPGCAVLVTSRHRMPDLEGVHDHHLVAPGPEEAMRLFADLAGRGSAEDHPTLDELVRKAENLPLALRLLANRWRQHPSWTLRDLTAQLDRTHHRLAEFRAGSRSLEAVFRMSLPALSPAAHHGFLRLGLHPVPEFGPHAAAAAMGAPLDVGRAVLDELADASLVDEPWPGRYTMHALLAEFARSCAVEEMSALDRHAARHRTMDYYLGACVAADRAYAPHRHRLAVAPTYPVELPEIDSRRAAVRWFAAERPTVLAVLAHAAREGGFETHEADMAHALADLLDTHTPAGTAVDVHRRAVGIRRGGGDRVALGHALLDLGRAQVYRAETDDAVICADEARHHFRETGDRVGQARALDLAGLVHGVAGESRRAREELRDAVRLAREADHPGSVAAALAHLAIAEANLGEYQAAVTPLAEALDGYEALGDARGVATTKGNLARIYLYLGLHRDAESLSNEAISLLRELGDQRNAARLASNLGHVRGHKGDHLQALRLHEEALRGHRAVRDHEAEIDTLCSIGRTYLNVERPRAALRYFADGWQLTTRPGDAARRVEILVGVGDARRALDDLAQAARCYGRALAAASPDTAPYQRALALAGLARLAVLDGDTREARALFDQARNLLSRIGSPDAEVMRILSDISVESDSMRPSPT